MEKVTRAYITARSSIEERQLFEAAIINFGLKNTPRNQWRRWLDSSGFGLNINDKLRLEKCKSDEYELTDLFCDSDVATVQQFSARLDISHSSYEFFLGPDEIVRVVTNNQLINIFQLPIKEIREILNLLT